MFWRLTRREWTAGKGAGNKKALHDLVLAGKKPGILGYVGRQPVGWCAVAPRGQYGYLERSRILKPVDENPHVWSVSCLFVAKPFRKQGLAVQMLQAVATHVGRSGGAIIEGYPTTPTMRKTPDPFLWTGTPSAFEDAGFQVVARRSKSRPIMRLEV